jgi:uncharacterized protein YfeS
MKPPLEFYLMARTYNCYGGHVTLSLIPGFLLLDAPSFGPALAELTVTMHFVTSGPPGTTLERMYADFHAMRLKLPKVVFRRSRRTANIDVSSDLIDGDEWEYRRGLSLSLFNAGFEEILSALQLLKTRLARTVDFRLDAFISHCEGQRLKLPASELELAELQNRIRDREAAIRAAKSPWEFLDIDWRDFHPDARSILDDPFFWECDNDFSPHGNDTGADLLEDYRAWLKRRPHDDPMQFLEVQARRWGMPLDESAGTDLEVVDDAAVALAFAEFKLRGACRPSAAEFALRAVVRQRDQALAAVAWPHREDRLKSLEAIETKLRKP